MVEKAVSFSMEGKFGLLPYKMKQKLKVNVTIVSHLHSRGLDRVNENFNPVHLILLPNLIDLAIAKLGNLAQSVNCGHFWVRHI